MTSSHANTIRRDAPDTRTHQNDSVKLPLLEPRFDRIYAQQRLEEMRGDPDIVTPFEHRLSCHIDIDEDCRTYLRELQGDPYILEEGQNYQNAGWEVTDISILQMGWMIGYNLTPSGQRFVYSIYQPGDFIGIEDLNWNQHSSTIACATNCVVSRFGKSNLHKIFEESPRLSRTIFSVSMMNQVLSFDRHRAASRLSAQACVAAFFLQQHSRALAAGTAISETEFALPLTQAEIGDAIGLTNVSVSRAVTGLTEQGLLKRYADKRIKFLSYKELAQTVDFTDRHQHIDHAFIGGREHLQGTPC